MTRSLAILWLFAGVQAASAQQPSAPAEAPAPQTAAPAMRREALSSKFDKQLQALDPSHPEDYYTLGEEVADEVDSVEDRRLAISLYVLAATLDTRRGGRPVTASAACLALSDLIRNERDRRWLLYLSRTLDPRRTLPEWLARSAPATADSPVYQMAAGLGLVRSGHGVQARQMLEKPEVQAGLERLKSMLSNMGGGSLQQIMREAQRWPCPECGNSRVTKRGSPPEVKICATCKGDPGPVMSEGMFLGQLRFESILLQGNQRSWAAQVAADQGAPLRDTDPSTLPVVFEVDPDKPLWRDGKWVVDPKAPKEPAPAKPPEASPADPASAPEKPEGNGP